MKFFSISNIEPRLKFQTFISVLLATISSIQFNNVYALNPFAVPTPKCLTLKCPHPSSSSGFKDGPSTIIEDT